MAKFTIALVSLFSLYAFAGLEECKNLLGGYSCKLDNESYLFSLRKGEELNEVRVTLGDESDRFWVDGKRHKSGQSENVSVANCTENHAIVVKDYVGKNKVAEVKISPTEDGLEYNIVKARGVEYTLKCRRLKK